MVDCNNCIHISITEAKQKDKSIYHICNEYAMRCLHKAMNKHHSPYIYPCSECVKDNYENYKERD
jgi:hypothetical protein